MLNFLHLIVTPPDSNLLYTGHYDPVLVGLSVLVAVIASYVALLVSQHVSTATVVTKRRLWIAVGGTCLGIGIWAMHFVGMLALSLPCGTRYEPGLTVLSMIPGILASILAMKIISRPKISPSQLGTGGLLLGAGIGTMHYSGMAAMHLDGLIRYDLKLFIFSIFVAVTLATFALWLRFRLLSWKKMWATQAQIISAVVMGSAISGMHYTAMAAAYFISGGNISIVDSQLAPTFLASVVLAATSVIIVMTIVASYVAKPNILSAGQSYKVVGLMVAGWVVIAWLSADYYYGRSTNNSYHHESQRAREQLEQVASNLDQNIKLLKGIALVIAGQDDTHHVLRRFPAKAESSSLPYQERKQRWTADRTLSDLDESLARAAANLGSDVIYVINAAGNCVAASNARSPGSFVGTNYADREYFRQACAGQRGHQYAVGRVSNMPGLFYSNPVIDQGHFLGAVVVKRDISNFSYLTSQANAFLSDANGVIVLASDKRLMHRFLPLASVANLPVKKRMAQYKQEAFETLEITSWGDERFPAAVRFGDHDVALLHEAKALPEDGVTIHVLRPLTELVRLRTERNWLFILLATAGSMLIVATSAIVIYLNESKKSAVVLRKVNHLNDLILSSAAEGIFGMDRDGNAVFVNDAALNMLGFLREELIGKSIHSLTHHTTTLGKAYPIEDCPIHWTMQDLSMHRVSDDLFWCKDGSSFPVEYVTAPLRDAGEVMGVVVAFRDISERKKAEKEIERLSQWNELLLNSAGEGIYGVDLEVRCTFINPAALSMLGFARDGVLGKNTHKLFHHHQSDGAPYPEEDCPIHLTLCDGLRRRVEDVFIRESGETFPVQLSVTPIEESGHIIGAEVVFQDISRRREMEAELLLMATTDPLTGMANRRRFMEQFEIELARSKRFQDPTALLMVDLDHFKKINDTYGHTNGDTVLKHLAGVAQRHLRHVDLIGRLGGEEFGILLPGTDAHGAQEFADRFRRQIADMPVQGSTGPISFTASIGIAEFDPSDSDADGILARADAALYRAKARGRNAVVVFTSGHDETSLVNGLSIVRLHWKPSYSCGEPTIDSEHRELFRLANTLLDRSITRDVHPDQFHDAFDALLTHVVGHFDHEEEILCGYHYERLDHHAEQHKLLVDRALKLRQQADTSDVSIGELVDFLVSDVVASHMLREDKDFFGLFTSR